MLDFLVKYSFIGLLNNVCCRGVYHICFKNNIGYKVQSIANGHFLVPQLLVPTACVVSKLIQGFPQLC